MLGLKLKNAKFTSVFSSHTLHLKVVLAVKIKTGEQTTTSSPIMSYLEINFHQVVDIRNLQYNSNYLGQADEMELNYKGSQRILKSAADT